MAIDSTRDGKPADRGERDVPELDLGPFRLQRDPAVVGGRVRAIIHQIAVDPDSDRATDSLDHYGVPLADRLLGVVGQIEDAPRLALRGPPLRRWAAPALHVGNVDVFQDAPEIAGILVLHLHLDGAREHAVERARRGRVHQNTRIPGRGGEAVFDLQTVFAVAG